MSRAEEAARILIEEFGESEEKVLGYTMNLKSLLRLARSCEKDIHGGLPYSESDITKACTVRAMSHQTPRARGGIRKRRERVAVIASDALCGY